MRRRWIARALALAVLLPAAAARADSVAPLAIPNTHPVIVSYWDKWTGPEKDAMQVVVNDFNRSQDRIYVEFQAVSDIPQKTLAATAGGVPPDIAGGWAVNIVEFADKNALTPLDELARGTNVTRDRYLPVYWDMGVYQGTLYGIPSTPATTALYWNKGLFRQAGLDPERPPRTIAELDEYAQKLTHVEKSGRDHADRLPAVGAAVVAVLLGELLRRAALGRRRAHDRRRAQQHRARTSGSRATPSATASRPSGTCRPASATSRRRRIRS